MNKLTLDEKPVSKETLDKIRAINKKCLDELSKCIYCGKKHRLKDCKDYNASKREWGIE